MPILPRPLVDNSKSLAAKMLGRVIAPCGWGQIDEIGGVKPYEIRGVSILKLRGSNLVKSGK